MSKKLGIEIVVTNLVVENIPKNLEYYDELLILCLDEGVEKKVVKQISVFDKEIRKKITIGLLKEHFISLI